MKRIIFFILFSILLVSCGGRSESPKFSFDNLSTIYTPKYAHGFELYGYGKHSSILVVKTPWQGAGDTELTYFLSGHGEKAPEGFDGVVVKKMPERVISMSSSYSAFMDALNETGRIVGVSGAQYIYNSTLRGMIERGDVRDVGYESGLNYELLVNLKPDMMFIYGVKGENSVITDKVKELGINIVYVAEYLESSPLGRAEWLVVMGEFFGKRGIAEALFNSIASEYERVRSIAGGVDIKKPRVLLNAPWRDTWFVPGDKSYVVQLINDAGGDYVFKGEDSEESRPISEENAYVKALDADFWLNPSHANTLSELLSVNPKFRDIPAVVSGRVYNNNARQGHRGGSDFWESGVVSPHVILRDLLSILHPELMPEHQLFYYKKIE